MPLHQNIQQLLLVGMKLETPPAVPVPDPPQRLQPLIDALAKTREEFDERAVRYGHRYCSGFWQAIRAAVTVILDEHQDWHMLVRPHHLPLG